MVVFKYAQFEQVFSVRRQIYDATERFTDLGKLNFLTVVRF